MGVNVPGFPENALQWNQIFLIPDFVLLFMLTSLLTVLMMFVFEIMIVTPIENVVIPQKLVRLELVHHPWI
jgi:hypothetical protein